MIPACFAENVQ